jgi:hypothetical protein
MTREDIMGMGGSGMGGPDMNTLLMVAQNIWIEPSMTLYDMNGREFDTSEVMNTILGSVIDGDMEGWYMNDYGEIRHPSQAFADSDYDFYTWTYDSWYEYYGDDWYYYYEQFYDWYSHYGYYYYNDYYYDYDFDEDYWDWWYSDDGAYYYDFYDMYYFS